MGIALWGFWHGVCTGPGGERIYRMLGRVKYKPLVTYTYRLFSMTSQYVKSIILHTYVIDAVFFSENSP